MKDFTPFKLEFKKCEVILTLAQNFLNKKAFNSLFQIQLQSQSLQQ